MKNNFVIFIRHFAALDHVLPFIDYVLINKKGTVQLILEREELPGAQDHLEFVNRIYKVYSAYFNDIAFSPFYKIIFRSYQKFLNADLSFYRRMPNSNFFLTVINAVGMRVYEFVLSGAIKRFIYGLRDSCVVMGAFGSELQFPAKYVVKYARKQNITTRCYPHGIYTSADIYNISKGKLKYSDLIKKKIVNKIRGKRYYYEKYLTCYYQKDTHFNSPSSGEFEEHKRIIEVGNLRYTYEWNDVIKSYLLGKYNFEYGDQAKLNVVLFISNAKYNVIPEMLCKTIKALEELEHINIVYRPRYIADLVNADNPSFKGCNALDIPSIVLSDWADIGIVYGSSIGFQLLLDKVPIIVPSYIHNNSTIYEKYDVCIKAENIKKLIWILSHDKKAINDFVDHEKSRKFINDMFYGNKTYQMLMEAYFNIVVG
ncbi:MAG: hypothetical protein CMI55_01850 [Parcubacteria group bacterium]|nr:hypothetical protein [Parcubacteria group bacterium]|tara:strand:+ start:955 stop:2235 length:1281 start_codon:yes stop_codon:yes gene_type:complete